jgi:hypothetical protein
MATNESVAKLTMFKLLRLDLSGQAWTENDAIDKYRLLLVAERKKVPGAQKYTRHHRSAYDGRMHRRPLAWPAVMCQCLAVARTSRWSMHVLKLP